jgi:transcriptional regulator with XRE-family HTH domain
MELKDRIRLIMEDQHMTQQVFADFLQLAPATLSSIFNGRTRPTLNIVEAIKTKIPDISADWLLWGTGEMYMSHPNASSNAPEVTAEHPVGGSEQLLHFEQPSLFSSPASVPPASFQQGVKNTHPEIVRQEIKIVDKAPRKVTEIRVYYDDQTYETFVPAKK